MKNAPVPEETKHPIWLPRYSPLTNLLIKDSHKKVMHNGTLETLAEFKTRFYTEKSR